MDSLIEFKLSELLLSEFKKSNFDITTWNDDLKKRRKEIKKQLLQNLQNEDEEVHKLIHKLIEESFYKIKMINKLEKIFIYGTDFSVLLLKLLGKCFQARLLLLDTHCDTYQYYKEINDKLSDMRRTSTDQKGIKKSIFFSLSAIVDEGDQEDIDFLHEIMSCFN